MMQETTTLSPEFEFDEEINETLEEIEVGRILPLEGRIYLELITLFCVVGGVTCILTATAISNFKNLLRQYHYKYLFHWNVINSFYLLFSPIFFRVFVRHIHYKLICIGIEFQVVMLSLNWIIVTLMVTDTMVALYWSSSSVKLRRHQRGLFIGLYLLGIFVFSAAISLCMSGAFFSFSLLIATIIMALCLIIVITFSFLHCCKRRKLGGLRSNVAFILASLYMFSWLVLWLFVVYIEFVDAPVVFDRIVVYWLMGTLLNPVVNTVILCKMDKCFEASLVQICKCRYNNYGDDMENFGGDLPDIAFEYDVRRESIKSTIVNVEDSN